MNRTKLASELVRLAKSIVAVGSWYEEKRDESGSGDFSKIIGYSEGLFVRVNRKVNPRNGKIEFSFDWPDGFDYSIRDVEEYIRVLEKAVEYAKKRQGE